MATSVIDHASNTRNSLATRAAAVSFTSNLTLMVLKLVVGITTGSIAVLSDGIDSAQDLVASTFALISIRLANQPADEEHPYGHGKAESIAAAGQAVLIAGGGGFIIAQSVRRLIDGSADIDTGPGLIALAITAVVNIGVAMYVGRAARITESPALRADTRHLWTNVAQACAVVTALGLVAITDHMIFDPIMAMVLAVYLLWTAGHMFSGSMTEIMDVRLPQREEQIIESCLRDLRGRVRGYHDLRTRKAGRQRHIDLHMLVDPGQSVADAHDICDELEQAIQAQLPDSVVTIHLDPDDGHERGPDHEEHVVMGGGDAERT